MGQISGFSARMLGFDYDKFRITADRRGRIDFVAKLEMGNPAAALGNDARDITAQNQRQRTPAERSEESVARSPRVRRNLRD